MTCCWRGAVGAWVLLGSLTVGLATGQTLAVGAHVGQYSPTQPIYEESRFNVVSPDGKYRLRGAAARGGTATLWFGERFGLALSGGKADTRLTFREARTSKPPEELMDASLRFGSLQAIAVLSRRRSILQPYLSVGLAYVRRGGEAFAGRDDNSRFGVALGAGLRVRVAKVLIVGGMEILDYQARYMIDDLPDRGFLQRDVQLKGGVEVPLFGR